MKTTTRSLTIIIASLLLVSCAPDKRDYSQKATSTNTGSNPRVMNEGGYRIAKGSIKIENVEVNFDAETNHMTVTGLLEVSKIGSTLSDKLVLDLVGTKDSQGFVELRKASLESQDETIKVAAKATCLGAGLDCKAAFVDIYVEADGVVYHHQVEAGTENLGDVENDDGFVSDPEMETEGGADMVDGEPGGFIGDLAADIEALFKIPKLPDSATNEEAPAVDKEKDLTAEQKAELEKAKQELEKVKKEAASLKAESEKAKEELSKAKADMEKSKKELERSKQELLKAKKETEKAQQLAVEAEKARKQGEAAKAKKLEAEALKARQDAAKAEAQAEQARKNAEKSETEAKAKADKAQADSVAKEEKARKAAEQEKTQAAAAEKAQRTPEAKPGSSKKFEKISQAVGAVNNGRLENPYNLVQHFDKTQNNGVQIIRQERKAYYSTNELAYVLDMISTISYTQTPGYKSGIGDVSRIKGGKLGRHKSHQIGVDADVAYYFKNKTFQGHFASAVTINKVHPDWMFEQQWTMFKEIEKTGFIDRIFIHGVMKKKLCEHAIKLGELKRGDNSSLAAKTLRRLIPEKDHHNHYHLRVKCSQSQVRCRQMAEPAQGSGCF